MKFLLAIFVIAVIGSSLVQAASEDLLEGICYSTAKNNCELGKQLKYKIEKPNFSECTAKYGGVSEANAFSDLQELVYTHIEYNFKFLFSSKYFGSYSSSRPGFDKLFRGLSDTAWEDSIELIKYITKRGGSFNMEEPNLKDIYTSIKNSTYATDELLSLSIAVDYQKKIADSTIQIHKDFSKTTNDKFDPEVASFLENNFVHKHSNTIRVLSGHVHDLKDLLTEHRGRNSVEARRLAVFMFDEYLEKL